MSDWLNDFLSYSQHGEAPEKLMYWVGVSTIAGALRRKVWIEEVGFEWTPNFYVLIVGPPGLVKKSTSIGVGMNLLRQVPGIDFGPQSTTWQQMITHMAGCTATDIVDGEEFQHSSCTFTLSEFGSFFDPKNRDLVDSLTDLWDGKKEPFRKETKTSGNDEIVNPWINIVACTTRSWVAQHFSNDLVGSGFGSRPIYVYADKRKRAIAYPSRNQDYDKEAHKALEKDLVERLRVIAEYAGPFKLTEEAYAWGEKWYEALVAKLDGASESTRSMVTVRMQTHLHKLAMVISAARGDFPVIDAHHLEEAQMRLKDLDPDVEAIFSVVGQSASTSASREIIEVLTKSGSMKRSQLYGKFHRTLNITEFELALKSALAAGKVAEAGNLNDPYLELRQ